MWVNESYQVSHYVWYHICWWNKGYEVPRLTYSRNTNNHKWSGSNIHRKPKSIQQWCHHLACYKNFKHFYQTYISVTTRIQPTNITLAENICNSVNHFWLLVVNFNKMTHSTSNDFATSLHKPVDLFMVISYSLAATPSNCNVQSIAMQSLDCNNFTQFGGFIWICISCNFTECVFLKTPEAMTLSDSRLMGCMWK